MTEEMRAYIDATAGTTDGTLVSVEGANTLPIPFAALNASVPVALRCTTGYEAPGSVVITAPELFEVSLTGTSSWGSTVTLSYVGDDNVRLWVRQVNAIPRDSSPYVLLGVDYGTALVDNAPSQVTGLAATNGNAQSVLTWDAATDNVGATGYKVYKDGTLLHTLGNVLTYTATGLTNGTTYAFTVRAFDAEGNLGAASAAANATPTAVLFFDDFNRADGALGANWSDPAGYASVYQNKLTLSIEGYSVIASAAGWIEDVKVTVIAVSGGYLGMILCRSQGLGNASQYAESGAYFLQFDSSFGSIRLGRVSAGYNTFLGDIWYKGSAFAAGDTVSISTVGTAIKGYHNGVLRCSATDSTYSGGYCGIHGRSVTGSDDFTVEAAS